ncbi:alginate export family protein [Pseudoalteromonas sp. SSDWG2]|uniref:alginate export family protein n=1 Tax=Pseudoalteromonas sp. SSDWG2 TaxID=3139391 RepID=UPI003BAABCC5
MKQCLTMNKLAVLCALACSTSYSHSLYAEEILDTLATGSAWADFRLRYETVDQDNMADNANALTLRTLFGVKSGEYKGFSATIEGEDSRIVLGVGDYSVGPTGYNVGQYPVIADPETTELDQAFVQYKHSGWQVKAGRQVITLDNHRFVGHVGWRQDRQTFDGITINKQVTDKLSLYYGYLSQRNRIFAEAADIDSNDHLLHLDYASDMGTFKAYGYLLETDSAADNGLDTWGVSYANKSKRDQITWHYNVEYATQQSDVGTASFDADYFSASVKAQLQAVTVGLGYELLGSDDGQYGFATPLATLHKFNGWTDQFLATPKEGLEDIYVTVNSQFAGGKWTFVWHEYSADDASASVEDLGSELNVQYVTKVAQKITLGAKYGQYFAEDIKADTSKFWLWVSARL